MLKINVFSNNSESCILMIEEYSYFRTRIGRRCGHNFYP
jgi:hypothetical protein